MTRKTTLLFCGALLASVCAATATAQTVSQTPVSNVEDLTDGYYVIKATKNDNSGYTGYIYYTEVSSNNRHYLVDRDRSDFGENDTPNFHYVWKLTTSTGEEENTTFTLCNYQYNTYFIADASQPGNMQGTATANLKVETDEDNNWFLTMTNYQHNGQKTYVTMNSNSPDQSLGWWAGIDNQADAIVQFYRVNMPETVTYDADFANEVDAALSATGVGYPTSTSAAREPLAQALETYKTDGTDGNVETENYQTLLNAYNDFLLSSNVQMPEDGKAYTLTFVGSDASSSEFYLNENENGQLEAVSRAADSNDPLPETARFIVRHTDGSKYLFVTPSGKYLVWKGNKSGTNSNSGFIDDYDETYAAMAVEQMNTRLSTSNMGNATTKNMFGLFSITGKRNGGSQRGCFILENNGSFNISETPYYNGTYTSAIRIEEAPDYYNTVNLKSPQTADGKTYGTVYLPFAADVPDGVTAYTATVDEDNATMNLTSVEGGVLPARCAAVLIGTKEGDAVLTPATTSPEAIEDNALQGTTSATEQTPTGGTTYVLSGAFGDIAFCQYSGENLAPGKAYFTLTNGNAVQAFRFLTTPVGIGALTTQGPGKDNTYYDLSGRRIERPAKGLYIHNGRKIYVK